MSVILTNSAFLHIPKTGGSWVTLVLREAGLIARELMYDDPEMTSERVAPSHHSIIKPEDRKPIVFTFVRHPLTWYRSYWKWKSQMFGWNKYNPLDRQCNHPDFTKFIENVISVFPKGYLNQLYPFFTRHCTHVGLYEHLERDFLSYMELAGEPFDKSYIGNVLPQHVSHGDDVKYSVSLASNLMDVESSICDTYNYNLLDNILK